MTLNCQPTTSLWPRRSVAGQATLMMMKTATVPPIHNRKATMAQKAPGIDGSRVMLA